MAIIPNNPVIPILDNLSNLLGPTDWKSRLKQGSFRGVPFKTQSHKYDSGRHAVEHEFPSKNEGNTEDLGKRLPTYSLELYVLGDDYFDQRDALMKALDADGAGPLIHPYLGTKNVQVGKYTLTETADEGRIARFSVEFSEAGEAKFPVEALDAFQSVISTVNNAIAVAQEALAFGFSIANLPARAATSAAQVINNAADQLKKVSKQVKGTAQGLADVAFAIDSIKNNAIDLAKEPAKLAQAFVDAYALLVESVSDFKELAKELSKETSSFSPDPIPGASTPTVEKIRSNQLAFENFFVAVSVSQASNAAVQGNYFSVDESVDVRELISGGIDRLLSQLTDDETFQAVKDLQVSLNEALPPQNVGSIVTFTPPKTLPALVISNRLFGTIEREADIIEQNKIKNPGFVEGGTEIEVVTYGT